MKKYLLDTNIIIDFLKGDKEAIQIMKKIQNNPFFISVITITEYNYGALKSSNVQKTLDLFNNFCQQADISLLNIDKKVAEKFAFIQAKLGKKGQLRPIFDLFIASTCLVNDCILVTLNQKDFIGIEGLKVF